MPASSTAATSRPGMAGLIDDSIGRTPGQVAIGVADGGHGLSYRQLGQLARVLTSQLDQAGIGHADPIALYSDNRPEFVVALLAAWTAGAAVPRARLAAFEIPKKIYFLNRFPRTSKGDGDRRALAAVLTQQGSQR